MSCAPLFAPAQNTKQSQSYLFFWDKWEKCNYFLENVLLTKDKPLDGRLLQHLLKEPICDGGTTRASFSIAFFFSKTSLERDFSNQSMLSCRCCRWLAAHVCALLPLVVFICCILPSALHVECGSSEFLLCVVVAALAGVLFYFICSFLLVALCASLCNFSVVRLTGPSLEFSHCFCSVLVGTIFVFFMLPSVVAFGRLVFPTSLLEPSSQASGTWSPTSWASTVLCPRASFPRARRR